MYVDMYSILYNFNLKIFNICMSIHPTTKVAGVLDILYKTNKNHMPKLPLTSKPYSHKIRSLGTLLIFEKQQQ